MMRILKSDNYESEERRIEQLKKEIEFLTIDLETKKSQITPKNKALR
jgi:hypothetical protein